MILLNPASWKDLGGWTVDSQFIDQMGSSFLLAHGLGRPVADAVCRFNLSTQALKHSNTFRLWVRTRDWVSPQGPGRFVVRIGDWTSKELGIGRGDWHWEDCGLVEVPQGEVEVRLHDLTGFEGRCAGMALTEPDQPPPNESAFSNGCGAMRTSRPTAGEYDFVVVGGGYAGLCAAVAAARQGVKTCLIHDRPVFGGNGSNEVRVGPIGRVGLKPFPRNSDLAYELMALTKGEGKTSGGLRPFFDDAKLEAWLAAEKNLTVFKNTRCVGVSSSEFRVSGFRFQGGEGIGAIEVLDVRSGERRRIQGKFFADCTGDAILAGLAGAELRTAPEAGESLKGDYGSTNFWTTRWTDRPSSFLECPWALRITDESRAVSDPKYKVEGDYPYAAGWNWESGFGKDAIKDAEWIRDYNFRAAYGMWDYLKNRSPEKEKYAKAEMDWLGIVLGKRAARRIVGDYVLTEKDLTEHLTYPDGVVTTTWFLDLHMPHPQNARHFPEGAFRSIAYDDPRYDEVGDRSKGGYKNIRPYAIPYRCFYSKNVPNLFMAGKDISATHVAMASVRVENTIAQMGAMIGRAVSLCVKHEWSPRQLGTEHFGILTDLLKKPGRMSNLAKQGQGRIGIASEVKYWMRIVYHKLKKRAGIPYMEEFAG